MGVLYTRTYFRLKDLNLSGVKNATERLSRVLIVHDTRACVTLQRA